MPGLAVAWNERPGVRSSGNHAVPVTVLTSADIRNTRRKLLLLALTGGRVMGSYDQMTLHQAFGSPICAAKPGAWAVDGQS